MSNNKGNSSRPASISTPRPTPPPVQKPIIPGHGGTEQNSADIRRPIMPPKPKT